MKEDIVELIETYKKCMMDVCTESLMWRKTKGWSNEDAIKHIETEFYYTMVVLKKRWEEIKNLSEENLSIIGFERFGEIMFIPYWLFPILPKDEVIYDVNGKKYVIGKDTLEKECSFYYGILKK